MSTALATGTRRKPKPGPKEQARRAKQIELEQSYLKALRETGKVVTNTAAIESVVGAG